MTQVKLTLVRSTAGRLPRHVQTVQGLGLRKTNSSAVVQLTPAIQGMIDQVGYLLKIEEV
ncbi:MAG: 50S ribosomal protein L30 [Thioalkalivibrionaceae bacterium]